MRGVNRRPAFGLTPNIDDPAAGKGLSPVIAPARALINRVVGQCLAPGWFILFSAGIAVHRQVLTGFLYGFALRRGQ